VIHAAQVGTDGLVWASDNRIYFDGLTQGGTTGLMRIDPGGGTPVQVTTVDTAAGEGDHVFPVSLPDGRGVLFTILARNPREPARVAVLDLEGGTPRILFQAATARYLPSGHLLMVTADGNLLAVAFDLDHLEVRGEPFAVTNRVATRAFGAVDLAVSDDGTVIYTVGGQAEGAADLVFVSRNGEVEPLDTAWQADFQTVALSPTGDRLAVAIGAGTEVHTWVKTLPYGALTKLSFEGNVNGRAAWHPDGRLLGYITNQKGPLQFWARLADGSGPGAVPLIQVEGQRVNEASWSADGEWLIYRLEEGTGVLYARRTRGDTTTLALTLSATSGISSPALSPDGRWIAYNSNESGTTEAYVRPFPDVERGRWTVSTAGGWEPHWSHSGREIFFFTNTNSLVAVEVVTTPTFATGRRQVLFEGGTYLGGIASWDLTADDQRFLFVRPGASEFAAPDLVVVENLAGELQQRGGR
jgi:serine/threonine-protein kinase